MVTRKMAVAGRWLLAGAGVAVASYAAYAATTWWRYGHVSADSTDARDTLLDQFMPAYEVAERHQIRVEAPADVTFAAAGDMHLDKSPIVRAIFRARELVMRSQPVRGAEPGPFLPQMRSIGWGVLGEVPGREVVMGAVTQPWKGDVVFRPVAPDRFLAFDEPDHVKIVWTLRADPVCDAASIFRTETRVATTDRAAREKFRRYWALASPGIIVIRWAMLGPLKNEAERRHRRADRTAA
jgi:hypothetical protein